ncbi:MAG: MBL fold metallo-hydrolase [Massilia sp.]
MKITLVSHASVIIDADGIKIWTDPWLLSKAFNNSWSLLGKPAYFPQMLNDIQYLWISHEHPDHFNIPTLKSLPDEFKKRVIVLFQQQNSEKIFEALRSFGFTNFQSLPNRRTVSLPGGVDVYCYQASFGDSCLGVKHGGEVVFNVNDAELSASDCRRVLKNLGKVDVVLNQFSLAGYNGYLNYDRVLPTSAKEKLSRLLNNHRDLGAKVTIPFASFVYFSSEDNRFLNRYGNSPQAVATFVQAHGYRVRFLFLGETASVSEITMPEDEGNNRALSRWLELYDQINGFEYTSDPPVALDEIQVLAREFSNSLRRYFPAIVLRRVKPLKFYIRDLGLIAEFDLMSGALKQLADPQEHADVLVNSQPLAASFKFPFGFETLAVSGRLLVQNNFKNWQWLKNITILWNNQLYLRPRYLLNAKLLRYVAARIQSGLLRQMVRKARMRAAAMQANNAPAEHLK